MTVIHLITQHDQLLEIWRSQNARSLKLCHLDFHCDMRGLLINRAAQRAYPAKHLDKIDEGNFITHAIKEGIIGGIRWAHYTPGGRQYDVGTVMYTTDLSCQVRRGWMALTGDRGIPLDYEVLDFKDWRGPEEGEFLNIDWDFLASTHYRKDSISARVEDFFSRDFSVTPDQVCVCYSPRYSHDSRGELEEFVHRLASLFNAEVTSYPMPERAPAKTGDADSPLRKLYSRAMWQVKHMHYEVTLALRQHNIY